MPAALGSAEARVKHERCRRSFRYFAALWHFVNRETGAICRFAPPDRPCLVCRPGACIGVGLWAGQEGLLAIWEDHQWVFGLKAGKLGFTELECAFDAWRLLFSHSNARVHLFSKDQTASKALLKYVKFGLTKLPSAWSLQLLSVAGGNTSTSLIVRDRYMEEDDKRECWSYSSTGSSAIDQSATHSHVDELSHMADGEALWNSVSTTVAPGGSCHVVTRGAGDGVYSYRLWRSSEEGVKSGNAGTFPTPYPFFAGYLSRPDRTPEDRRVAAESGSMTMLGVSYYLPETAEDALRGDEESPYIPLDRWDALYDRDLPPLAPGDRTTIVISLDAGVTNDCFAAVAVSRHPQRHEDVAIRAVKVWRPDDFPSIEGQPPRIDFDVVERWVRFCCEGGCPAGHPRSMPNEGCPGCQRGERLAGFNVVQVCYDPHQLEDMAQRLNRLSIVWMKAYEQGEERLVGDALMFRKAMTGTLSHNGDPTLREHIGNAKAKLQPDQESQMRIVKKSPEKKIDAAVAAAMGCKRILELNI